MEPELPGAGKVYREVVDWPLWFHLLMGLVSVGALWGCVEGFRDPEPAWLPPVLCLTALSLLGVWWFFRHLEIEVGPEGVGYGFGGIRRRVPRERIAGLEVETYSVARYMGWGYRIGWGKGDRAFSLIGYRRGLRLHFTDERGKEWHIFLSSADPDAAVAAYAA
jgi:hypothetical protein